MDRTKLKNYAPQARREFIQAMIDRAAFYGLTGDNTEPVVEKGDVAVIGGRSFPIAVARKRKALEDRIKRHGFQQAMEAMAYTWFNRLVAIRYMELHGYLDHGYKVLSHPGGKPTPEILEHAEHVELPGLRKDRVIDLKLAGNKEGELYRLLLTAQCNALHNAMPFLFERIDDETELLLPDNLLNSDSLIRKLVNEIKEEDWNEVEIIGWLYQFYISERKDEVIGKVVASEDIPAATQLFTPNWIVKYLLQNTLGRQWLATYPQSALRQQMEYYIEPAEQTLEVQEQLKAITLTSLNPEDLTLLDPACGSGHILVEAYDLFKAIYLERGYRAKDIPALILQKNLFGLEIDDRAAQLAAFALLMKARADDRRIFDSEAKPNILAFEDSQRMKASEIYFALTSPLKGEKECELESPAPDGHLFEPDDNLFTRAESAKAADSRKPIAVNVSQADITALLELFENAKTFGSLIQIPPKLAAKLPEIEKRLENVLKNGDLTHASAHVLKPLLQQARLLAQQYDTVVANPPYMGSKYLSPMFKSMAQSRFSSAKHDTFSMFMERCLHLSTERTSLGFVTPYVWMFISSYQKLREDTLTASTLTTLIQLEYNAFEPACVPVCAFTLSMPHMASYRGDFIKLSDFKGHQNQSPRTLEAIANPGCAWRFRSSWNDIRILPGTPVAYWMSDQVRHVFATAKPISEFADARQGLATTDNGRFVRKWWEVPFSRIGFGVASKSLAAESGLRWFPYNKGGEFRKWYGNIDTVVNWEADGREIKATIVSKYPYLNGNPDYVAKNQDYYFRAGVTWSDVTSSSLSFRLMDDGVIPGHVGHSAYFTDRERLMGVLALLNTPIIDRFSKLLSPTLHFDVGYFKKLPFLERVSTEASECATRAVEIARNDWNSHETSWDFDSLQFVATHGRGKSAIKDYEKWEKDVQKRLHEMKHLEEENNRLFIESYGLQEELPPEVSDKQITLYRPDRTEDIKRLLSYAIGCVMGRYSLDRSGLVYAGCGNEAFDQSQYQTIRADDDGIIPFLETDWGIRDDAANRLEQFVCVAWSEEYLEENLAFIADCLGPNTGEQPRETIRRCLATGFYKHHLSMYKKRPIYWLFSSGKQRAFQCLVYLHRYNEGTLARMRTEYVIPLQGQISARIEQLEGDKAKATSTSHRTKIQKEQDKLKKQQAELAMFEEKLKHYADMRISLDLDDGVKVNYAKFGDLLAESKAITGGKDDE
jgi:type II restriction/modification system DNA methylase subunit YeeA